MFAWVCVTGSALPGAAAAADNPAAAQELQQVVVIGNAPLPGLGLPLNHIPANVQTADSEEMQRQQTLSLADYLNNNFSGISVSESADNPFQLDINYHGFTASPLLGTPEGLSVYVDGVRVNESFGDTVNWDLIPESAISTVTLMSGSNPVFGLNTLGGALSVHTKSGHDNPGTELEAYGGSFGRRSLQGQTGGEAGPFDYFLTGTYFDETGWRDGSSTRVYQGFGKVGWQNDETDIDLSYTYADARLFGNGAAPLSLLDFRRETSYTPDFTHNRLDFVNLTGTQFLTPHLLLAGNLYDRRLVTGSSNGNVNDSYIADNYTGPQIDCTAPPTGRADIAFCANGQTAVSRLIQRTAGFGVQLTDSQDVFGMKNQAIVGADYEDSRDTFAQVFQYGTLAADRTLVYETNPLNGETVISLNGSNKILGGYLTDTLSPSELLHFTASVRYNRNTETLSGYSIDTDVGDVGSGYDQPSPLAGDHTFTSINPAFGFTVTPTAALTFYANYNEASRAPTVIELGCSNPAAPCGLPNNFASDPDLKQVVARTVELGLRSNPADQRLQWSADVFRTINRNDLQFVAASTNQGYFDNVGTTRRQGVDLALGGKAAALSWHLTYSYVDASYESSFSVNASSNSTADANGKILVRPGERIPLIPRHTGRLVVDYEFNPHWHLGANAVLVSGSFLHGNENNANQGGATNGAGALIEGSGRIPGYAVVNFQGSYHFTKDVEFFARLVNVLDKEYATAGFVTTNAFNPNGSFRLNRNDWTHENAVSPAQPRAVWAGVRVRFN
jgi:outer membrane receptor protein involved in Fe transport